MCCPQLSTVLVTGALRHADPRAHAEGLALRLAENHFVHRRPPHTVRVVVRAAVISPIGPRAHAHARRCVAGRNSRAVMRALKSYSGGFGGAPLSTGMAAQGQMAAFMQQQN